MALLLALALLSGCSGGNDSSPPPPVAVANRAPVFTSAASVSAAENVTGAIYQASASDADGDALGYSITGGADAARFTLTGGGQLAFASAPNFELPGDADGDNVYQVQISANDGKVSTALALAVTVTNTNEGVAVHRVATGFVTPVAIAPISDTAMLVAEKAGAIYLLNPQSGAKTLLTQVANVGGVGITALVAAPTFAADGTFFVMYATQNGFLVINRFLHNPAGPTVPDGFGFLLAVSAPLYAGGGWLGYDASGTLLAATGDAGGNGDPTGSAQDDSSRLGKILRIAPNPDPYAGASPAFFLVSTLAKGVHQPNGGSPFGTSVVIADHGQDVAEELDLVAGTAGANYGWPFKEGTQAVRGAVPAGLTDPALEYLHSAGVRFSHAIVGGARGPSSIASLRDQYVFGDGGGAIFTVAATALTAGKTTSADSIERRAADFAPDQGKIDHPVAITAGPAGTLYILDSDGEIFRVDAG